MKKQIRPSLNHVLSIIFIFITSTICLAQNIEEALLFAAKRSEIQLAPATVTLFSSSLKNASESVRFSVNEISTEQLTERFVKYFKAKKIKPGAGSLTPTDIQDFNWIDLATNPNWISVKVPTTSKSLKLTFGETNRYFEGFLENGKIEWIAIPEGNFSLKAANNDREYTTWMVSGSPPSKELELFFPTSEGCEIFIKSVPDIALVFFNGKVYHKKTNTSSVREPGKWKILIKKDGYKEWVEEKTLSQGDIWDINATLTKEK